jgi:hypothetical protein
LLVASERPLEAGRGDDEGESLFLIVELQDGVVVATAFRGDEDEDDEG